MCAFIMHNKKASGLKSFIISVRNDPFPKNYVASEGAVCTMFCTIYSSPLLITK